MNKIYTDITELFYACCYGKATVEIGTPRNFESSKVNITAFERELKKVLRKYSIKPAHPTTKPTIKEET